MEKRSIAPQSSPYNDFRLFPLFPREIRFRIWREASLVPRYVFIWEIPLGNIIETEQSLYETFRYITTTPPPLILSVSSEARQIGLESYKMSFGVRRNLAHGARVTVEPRIYVNWESDIICPMEVGYDFWRRTKMERIAVNISAEPARDLHFLQFPALREVLLYEYSVVMYAEVEYLAEHSIFDFVELEEPDAEGDVEYTDQNVVSRLLRTRRKLLKEYDKLQRKPRGLHEDVEMEGQRSNSAGGSGELQNRPHRPVVKFVQFKVVWRRDRQN